MDNHGNEFAKEGCDRCVCGSKYWENDRCIDCQTPIHFIRLSQISDAMSEEEKERYAQTNPIRIWMVAGISEEQSIAISAN